ncbi:hypothetical protein [Brachybacterium squillarum]|uniref:hypothetical protein n=1 Tax=Brachybacterium squillarum TaxID=661979 RepID=UPI002223DB74|nr:hypothetical protein [Brachybacterium squillarum]MCW1805271.1 hypothetical protein [Brachybacterium squillarum]
MELQQLKTSLVSQLYDRVHVTTYGDGYLVATPFAYSDGDVVTVAVFPLGAGFRVTDREEAIDRLEDAGIDLERNARARQLRAGLTRDARLISLGSTEHELSHATESSGVAEAVLTIGALAQQVEQLRYLARELPPRLYRDVVRDDARSIANRHSWNVKMGAEIRLRSGSRRKLTARVEMNRSVAYVQALSTPEAIASTFLTFYAFDVDPEQKLAVVDERAHAWPMGDLETLEEVSSLVHYQGERDLAVALENIDSGRPTVLA